MGYASLSLGFTSEFSSFFKMTIKGLKDLRLGTLACQLLLALSYRSLYRHPNYVKLKSLTIHANLGLDAHEICRWGALNVCTRHSLAQIQYS